MTQTRILHQSHDELGALVVREDSHYRTLSFGADDEQSCSLKAAPHVLQHEYTQAMLLVLLFCKPKRALVLGLGGGCLATALHAYLPGIKMTAVELRPRVVELAYQYFQLPRSKRLQVVPADAYTFVTTADHRKVDVVFADLYHADGVDPAQLQNHFISQSAAFLKADGWLVLNCWHEHHHDPVLLAALRENFVDVRTVATGSKNWVILAGRVKNTSSAKQLKQDAQRLSAALGYSLSRHLARLSAW